MSVLSYSIDTINIYSYIIFRNVPKLYEKESEEEHTESIRRSWIPNIDKESKLFFLNKYKVKIDYLTYCLHYFYFTKHFL